MRVFLNRKWRYQIAENGIFYQIIMFFVKNGVNKSFEFHEMKIREVEFLGEINEQ